MAARSGGVDVVAHRPDGALIDFTLTPGTAPASTDTRFDFCATNDGKDKEKFAKNGDSIDGLCERLIAASSDKSGCLPHAMTEALQDLALSCEDPEQRLNPWFENGGQVIHEGPRFTIFSWRAVNTSPVGTYLPSSRCPFG